ncbi:hypothetical protein BV20DRAFT_780135 [Pilatotrama ljubarskyi]|nr:hypothetical protein BV20DRAFT_780135 [Pilatotrama ljubarskyi]
MSAPPCPQCLATRHLSGESLRPTTRKESRPDLGFYTPGYICCVHDSLATAIELIFSRSPGIKENKVLRDQFLEKIKEIYAAAAAMKDFGKERPCIIMNTTEFIPGQGGARAHPLICIMGTFEGTPYEQLARVYQHFCVAVFPNRGVEKGGRDHIHIWPGPWPHPRQWILAFEYRSPGPILSTWPPLSKRRTNTANTPEDPVFEEIKRSFAPMHWLDAETFTWFREQCSERLDSWDKMCGDDPDLAQSCAFEYRQKCFFARSQRFLARVNRQSSRTSINSRTSNSRPRTPLAPAVPNGANHSFSRSPHRPGGSPGGHRAKGFEARKENSMGRKASRLSQAS